MLGGEGGDLAGMGEDEVQPGFRDASPRSETLLSFAEHVYVGLQTEFVAAQEFLRAENAAGFPSSIRAMRSPSSRASPNRV